MHGDVNGAAHNAGEVQGNVGDWGDVRGDVDSGRRAYSIWPAC
jgi:hypothetical protein